MNFQRRAGAVADRSPAPRECPAQQTARSIAHGNSGGGGGAPQGGGGGLAGPDVHAQEHAAAAMPYRDYCLLCRAVLAGLYVLFLRMAAAVSGEGEKRALEMCMAVDCIETRAQQSAQWSEGVRRHKRPSAQANSFALVPAYLSPAKSIKLHAHGGRYAPQFPATRRE